jgi:alpha-L-rhamnosidase
MQSLQALRVEYRVHPLAVGTDRPRFSWRIESGRRGVVQVAYRITASGAGDWDSGWVDSTAMNQVEWAGPVPARAGVVEWTLSVRLDDGEVLTATSSFETPPSPATWDEAAWITLPRAKALHPDRRPTPYLRRRFDVRPGLVRGRLYATAGGVFQPWLNGASISRADLAPGWTDYRYRVPFHAYDLTSTLHEGVNTVGAILGDGWYCGFIGPFIKRDFWGDVPVLRALVLLEYADGTIDWITTGDDWEGSFGAIRGSDMLAGEVYDARLDIGDWTGAADTGRWRPAVVERGPQGALVPAWIEAVGPVAEIAPVSITEPVPGDFLVDFGQNIAGRVALTATGPAGTVIRMRHAEILDDDGALYTDNLRNARATDIVVLAGGGAETFEPVFTFHGFRYLEITGYPGRPTPDDVRAIVVSSLAEMPSTLVTGVELVDRLHENIRWTMRNNFLEVPMDCPQRDERLGWGGDAQAFSYTSTYFADVAAFHSKWIDDILDAQKQNGAYADIAPGAVLEFAEEGAAGYADAGVIVPWHLYLAYGDTRILERSWDGAVAWIDHIVAQNPGLVWREGRRSDYGDWLAVVETDKALVATAYLARAVLLVSRYAAVLGRDADADRYRALHGRIAAAYRREFLDTEGRALSATQTAQVLGVEFELLEPAQAALATESLLADIERHGHLTTGFLAVGLVLPQVSAAGRDDLAQRVLTRTESPSWGYQIGRGMTTIGEHWDAWLPDGTLRDPWMNSFDHFALGSVGQWMYQHLGGIHAELPGYERVLVDPRPGPAITGATAGYDSIRGPIRTRWSVDGESFELDVEIPANTAATVVLPGGEARESGADVAAATGVVSVETATGRTLVSIGSGRYRFTSRLG